MLEALRALPDGVIGFEAAGHVRPDDDVAMLVAAIESAAAKGPVRLAYALGDRIEGWCAGAMWQDTRARWAIAPAGSAWRWPLTSSGSRNCAASSTG